MSVLGVVAVAGLCAGAQEFRLRHYMRMVDAMQPSSSAFCIWVVLHWSTQFGELEPNSTALEDEPPIHLAACPSLSCRRMVHTVAVSFLVASHASSYWNKPVGSILHLHCMHQFPTCDSYAGSIQTDEELADLRSSY